MNSSHHGSYHHSCSSCSKQGRNLWKPSVTLSPGPKRSQLTLVRALSVPPGPNQQRLTNGKVTVGGIRENKCNNELITVNYSNIHDVSVNYHNVYPKNCKNLLCHNLSATGCCQADGRTFKNYVNACSQYSDQRFNSRFVTDAGCSTAVVHTLDSVLIDYGKAFDSASCHNSSGGFENAIQLRGCQPSQVGSMGYNRAIQGLFWVDFTSFTHFNPLTNKRACMVFVHNLGHQGQEKFCYLIGDGSLAAAELVSCNIIPTGKICISHSRLLQSLTFNLFMKRRVI